jgi:uncharacterized membrane protein YeaQ/YmgE (transglycosylase-associated protein family)
LDGLSKWHDNAAELPYRQGGAFMWLIWTIVIGLLAGWLVAFLVKDRRAGLVVDLLIGIGGSILGGLISKYLGMGRHSLFGRAVISMISAVFFLIVQQVVKRS